jgi:DNA-binding HxlR family transcriptional regulator
MKRTSFAKLNCSLAQTLEVVGEWWSLLIIREAMWGTSRFDDFQSRLGLARNVLSTRLASLEKHQVLKRIPVVERSGSQAYVLTERGWDLLPSVAALMQWGDRWVHHKIGPPMEFFDSRTNKKLAPMVLRSDSGAAIDPSHIEARAGRGANRETKLRAAQALAQRSARRNRPSL